MKAVFKYLKIWHVEMNSIILHDFKGLDWNQIEVIESRFFLIK